MMPTLVASNSRPTDITEMLNQILQGPKTVTVIYPKSPKVRQ